MNRDAKLYDLLKQYWGYETFRAQQKEIISSVLDRHDTLALLPTGGGKSICYQLPALYLDGICVVISPLIALMQDQVAHLKNQGVRAEAIFSGMPQPQIERILNNCVYGKIKILYLSPERLKSELFMNHFRQMSVTLIAVDEAHCISQWGNDFRPDYTDISAIRPFFPQVPVLALTATATPRVVEDIQQSLLFQKPHLLRTGFERKNLSYMVFKEEDKYGRLVRILQKQEGTAIIYVRNRRMTEEVTRILTGKGISADFYHAGLSAELRISKQKQWTKNSLRVIVATNAFGMGIDKPDVRLVIHLDLPESPEAYFQEAGRAGRDGKRAYAVLLYNASDQRNLEERIQIKYPPISFIHNVYVALYNFLDIPIGGGMHRKSVFDFSAFCHTYDFSAVKTFQALKLLEKAGYFRLNDSFRSRSTLWVTVDRETLYQYAVTHPYSTQLIHLLMRSYGGIFSSDTEIQEKRIAKQLDLSYAELTTILKRLQKAEILTYEPQSSDGEIVLLSPRVPTTNIEIPQTIYQDAKKQALVRRDVLIAYLQQSSCRVKFLLKYFGDDADDCGSCDVCILKKKWDCQETNMDIRQQILKQMEEGNCRLDSLLRAFPTIAEDQIIMSVRRLLDEGEIEYKGSFLLGLKHG